MVWGLPQAVCHVTAHSRALPVSSVVRRVCVTVCRELLVTGVIGAVLASSGCLQVDAEVNSCQYKEVCVNM